MQSYNLMLILFHFYIEKNSCYINMFSCLYVIQLLLLIQACFLNCVLYENGKYNTDNVPILMFDIHHTKEKTQCYWIQGREEALTEQQARLAEVRALAAEIASRVGLALPQEGGSNNVLPLAGEVEALGRRLEDVRHAIATLAEAAESRAAEGDLCGQDLQETRTFLNNVQQVCVHQNIPRDIPSVYIGYTC
jgi:hypothetical protein